MMSHFQIQIPTTILCKEVSKYGKVFLTGDGGDEVFGGYNRYIYINFFNNLIKNSSIFRASK